MYYPFRYGKIFTGYLLPIWAYISSSYIRTYAFAYLKLLRTSICDCSGTRPWINLLGIEMGWRQRNFSFQWTRYFI